MDDDSKRISNNNKVAKKVASMLMKVSSWVVLVVVAGPLFWGRCVGSAAEGNSKFPALLAFGDSLLDTGNNNYLPTTLVKSNFPPYGRNLPGGPKPTGRFSDGTLISDLLAEKLGIKKLLPPYLDPKLGADDLTTGVAFASAGTGYDPATSKLAQVLSISDQIKLFQQYKDRLGHMIGEQRSNNITRDSLYVISSGNNDVLDYFITNRQVIPGQDMDSYATFLVNQATVYIKELTRLGARNMVVFNAAPIGCLPISRTLAGGVRRECAESPNELANLFNSKLRSRIMYLNGGGGDHLPSARIVYVDLFALVSDIIRNPTLYGFVIVRKGCCGTGTVEVAVLCNELNPFTCDNTSEYVFWDSVHPTEKTNAILASHIVADFCSC